MEIFPEAVWVYCPHELQKHVDCSDESAKELAGLVYEYALDYEFRDSLRKGASNFQENDLFMRLTTFLMDYDVFPAPNYKGLVLYRFERPPIGKEAHNHSTNPQHNRNPTTTQPTQPNQPHR